jgi:hypothetical protein
MFTIANYRNFNEYLKRSRYEPALKVAAIADMIIIVRLKKVVMKKNMNNLKEFQNQQNVKQDKKERM